MALFESTFPPYHPFGSRNLRLLSPHQLRGTDVAVFQAIYNLMRHTMTVPIGTSDLIIDGHYGNSDRQAAIHLQNYFGLTPDGIVGPNTFFVFGQGVGAHTTYGGPVFGSRTLSQGSSGGDVKILQNRLNLFRYGKGPADGIFGPLTASAVLAFKADAITNGQTGLQMNAVVGDGTFDAFWLYTFLGGRAVQTGRNGFDVVFLQKLLKKIGFYGGTLNGFYDMATRNAVLAFQASQGISVDGVVGPVTFYRLGLQNQVAAPSPLAVAWP